MGGDIWWYLLRDPGTSWITSGHSQSSWSCVRARMPTQGASRRWSSRRTFFLFTARHSGYESFGPHPAHPLKSHDLCMQETMAEEDRTFLPCCLWLPISTWGGNTGLYWAVQEDGVFFFFSFPPKRVKARTKRSRSLYKYRRSRPWNLGSLTTQSDIENSIKEKINRTSDSVTLGWPFYIFPQKKHYT